MDSDSVAVGTAPPPPPPVFGRIRSKTCDVRHCGANSLLNPELLFVTVPTYFYPERRFVWLTLMQAARDKKRSYCCSRHFTVPDDFKDFQEFITAPPGYKRQLTVKRGVVPHLNMPQLNMPQLPPLSGNFQMTLPADMTVGGPLPRGPPQGGIEPLVRSAPKISKAVQTETVFSGFRRIKPSLQYCRLCLQRQNLEPIFTGDQTLIEPDLIDKIYGCTQILITVEHDFPSSICTGCYDSVQDFIKFRRSAQKNDQSLRSMSMGNAQTSSSSPSHLRQPPAATYARIRPVEKLTPMRPAPTVTPTQPARINPFSPGARWNKFQQHQHQRQQQYQETIRMNQPLRQTYPGRVPQQTPPRQPVDNPADDTDPFANVVEDASPDTSVVPEGVQMHDRVVPVTLIRIQADPEPEVEASDEERYEDERSSLQCNESLPVEEVARPDDTSRRSFLQPKPIEQLLASARKSLPAEPDVLQAVELVPSSVAKEVVKQKNAPKIFLRDAPVPSKRLDTPGSKQLQKTFRPVKFPLSLNTLFSAPKRPMKLKKTLEASTKSPVLVKYNTVPSPSIVEVRSLNKSMEGSKQTLGDPKVVKITTPNPPLPKPTPVPQVKVTPDLSSTKPTQITQTKSTPNPPRPKPTQISKIIEAKTPEQVRPQPKPVVVPQILKEVKRLEKSATVQTSLPKPKIYTPPLPKQKENNVPESPKTPSSEASPSITSPRSTRIRKVPSKFDDMVGFPMPRVITVKPEPEPEPEPAKKAPSKKTEPGIAHMQNVLEKRTLKVRVQDVQAKGRPVTKPESSDQKLNIITEKPVVVPAKNRPETKDASPAQKWNVVVRKPASKVQTPTEPVTRAESKQKWNIVTMPPFTKVEDPKLRDRSVVPNPFAKVEAPATRAKARPQKPNILQAATKKPAASSTKKIKEEPQPKGRPSKRKSDIVADEADEEPTAKRSSPRGSSSNSSPAPSTARTSQKANGSRKSVPAARPAPKPAPAPTPAAPRPAQQSKCPFCTDRLFDEKKALVKHLRKRHGMDYALVRQRLAIYGGNW